MKKSNFIFIASFLLLCYALLANAQDSKLNYISKLPPLMVDSIEVKDSDTLVFLPFGFNKAEISSAKALTKLNSRVILGTDLVYCTFVELKTFDQQKLNYSRLENLKKILPQVFEYDMIEWRLIGENAYSNETEAHQLFSGFVFHLRPLMDSSATKTEISLLKKITEEGFTSATKARKKTDSPAAKKLSKVKCGCLLFNAEKEPKIFGVTYNLGIEKPLAKKPKNKGGDNAFYSYMSSQLSFTPPRKFKKKEIWKAAYAFQVDENGLVSNPRVIGSMATPEIDSSVVIAMRNMPAWSKGNLNHRKLEYHFEIDFHKSKGRLNYSTIPNNVVVGGLTLCNVIDTASKPVMMVADSLEDFFLPDSTVFKAFTRNQTWSKMLVAVDLTGSMYPYTSQLLIWLKLHAIDKNNPIKHITFFNDGNAKKDANKKIGSTGGIYHIATDNFDFNAVLKLAEKTMMQGNGSDCPENNVEAVIEGIKECADCNDVVMIADNYATPRDMEILAKVKKPVKIILCGTRGGINPKYLDFVRKNGGSLHTIDSDITNLMKLHEKEEVEIGGEKFIIKNGNFMRIY